MTSPPRSNHIVAGAIGSNLDISQAVEVTVVEVSLFEEIMERIKAPVTEFRQYKEQREL